jgi:hypothetical protein
MPLSRKRRLPLLSESDASGRTLEIYEEIKLALGVPQVNVIFQAYGVYPRFLDLMWNQLRPALETQDFFQHADRLRAEVYTRMHNYFSVPDLGSGIRQIQFSTGAQHELTGVVELFHYNNPLLLLITALQIQAFEDGPAHRRVAKNRADHPVFAHQPVKVPEDSAPLPIKKTYDDIKRTLGVSFINTDYQAFARFPDFLNLYWNALKPAISSPLYGENKHALQESAMSLAGDLPNAPQLSVEHMQDAGLSEDEISAGIHITEEFLEVLSGLVLNIAFAKISLEGGNRIQVAPRAEKKKEQVLEPVGEPPEKAA